MTTPIKPVTTPSYDHWLGNYKVLLIFMVVFGHLIETFRDLPGNDSVRMAYNVIYLLHMLGLHLHERLFFQASST
ncbi:hypothetical protein OVA29_20245 [Exiguobacterium sp. SL14]|nr:hypothetical protein [Exiguobacterium sp. SL14]MCY1692566.1 hypothetical protein [Exiguobacterium sp. SL14]